MQPLRLFDNEITDCRDCDLHRGMNPVPGIGIGTRPYRVMLVGEAPGADEDRARKPFVGQAGQLLQELVLEIGLVDSLYVTNVVKHRPPQNRTPERDERFLCSNRFLFREVDETNPRLVLCLGRTAGELFLDCLKEPTQGPLRGQGFVFEGTQGLITHHPARCLPGRAPELLPELRVDLEQAYRLTR